MLRTHETAYSMNAQDAEGSSSMYPRGQSCPTTQLVMAYHRHDAEYGQYWCWSCTRGQSMVGFLPGDAEQRPLVQKTVTSLLTLYEP
jgi:hypothetical protein